MTTTARALVAAVALLLAALGGLVAAGPAAAAEVEVRLTAEGPVPAAVSLPAGGGTVVFRLDDGASHTVSGAGFTDRTLNPVGGPAEATISVTASGTLTYTDQRAATLIPPASQRSAQGTVTVAAPPPAAPAPAPAAPPAPAPPPPAPPAAPVDPPAAPAPAPDQPLGGGTAGLPGLPGTVDLGQLTGPVGQLPAFPPALTDPLVAAGPTAAPTLPPVQAVQGPLPGAGTSRGLGLPAALAVLAAVGVASLLVRVLLAEPAAERARGFTAVQVSTAG